MSKMAQHFIELMNRQMDVDFIQRTLGLVSKQAREFWEGQEFDAHFDGGEFSSKFYSPEVLERELEASLRLAGWRWSVGEYAFAAAKVVGVKQFLRRYNELAVFSADLQFRIWENANREFDARDARKATGSHLPRR
jgi:hypothetical protein